MKHSHCTVKINSSNSKRLSCKDVFLTLCIILCYAIVCSSTLIFSVLVVFLFTLQQGVSFCFAVTDYCAIAQSWASLGNHDRNALQETSFFVLFVWYHGGCIYQNKLVEYSFIVMLQSNCKPLTAAAVLRPCNEMEDESDWHCAKGYCQCNTTSVIPPVRKAMSVKRRCLGRLSQNMPQWQTSRKELHPLEGKLIDLNLFIWVWHCQLHHLNGQTMSATRCSLENVLEDVHVCW